VSVIIQDDYWTGSKCVENAVPWQTPGSIHYLDEVCQPTDTVLEIGTGGSTLFYASRCKSVIAIETNADWYAVISKILVEQNITNVTYLLIQYQDQIEAKIKTLEDCSIVSVDSVHGYNRSGFLTACLETNKTFRVLVLDNYGEIVLFPDHYDKSIEEIACLCPDGKWFGVDYNDIHWCGRGTRILTKRQG